VVWWRIWCRGTLRFVSKDFHPASMRNTYWPHLKKKGFRTDCWFDSCFHLPVYNCILWLYQECTKNQVRRFRCQNNHSRWLFNWVWYRWWISWQLCLKLLWQDKPNPWNRIVQTLCIVGARKENHRNAKPHVWWRDRNQLENCLNHICLWEQRGHQLAQNKRYLCERWKVGQSCWN
jgi:hypothetical protein